MLIYYLYVDMLFNIWLLTMFKHSWIIIWIEVAEIDYNVVLKNLLFQIIINNIFIIILNKKK